MSAVTVVSFDLVFIFERWLRHTGRLTRNTSWVQKGLSILAIIAAIGGAAGLILLSIFDTYRHPQLHDDFLILFIVGYVVSAIVVCAEYQRLGIHYREYRILRISFWIKLMFIIIEVALAIGKLPRRRDRACAKLSRILYRYSTATTMTALSEMLIMVTAFGVLQHLNHSRLRDKR